MLNSVLNTSHRTIFHHHTSDISDCRRIRWQMFFKIGVLKNFSIFTGKHSCWSRFVIKLKAFRSATLLKETPTQVFSYEYCKIFKNNLFYRIPMVAASLTTRNIMLWLSPISPFHVTCFFLCSLQTSGFLMFSGDIERN